MANCIQFLISVTLVFFFVSLVYVNSLPANTTIDVFHPQIVTTLETSVRQCYTDADCNHGQCNLNKTSCECERGWTAYNNRSDTNISYCAYAQRSKQTAFFLSLFTGIFGADWFYLARSSRGYIIAGILKLLSGCGCCSIWLLTYLRPEIQNSASMKLKFRGISTGLSLLVFVWWVVDWVRVLGNKFLDGNGIGLIPW